MSLFVNVVGVRVYQVLMNYESTLELRTVFLNSFALFGFMRYVKNCLLNLIGILQTELYRHTLFLLLFPCACLITRLHNFYGIPLFLVVLSLGTTFIKSEDRITFM